MKNLRFATLALVALIMSALLAACSGPGSGGLDPGSTEGTFALEVVVQGQGVVTIDDLEFECTNECTARIGAGVTVELRAQAQGETGFAGWHGACNGTGTCTVTMDSDKAVTALFADNVLLLDIQGDGQASVRVEPGDDCASDCVRAYDSPVNVSLLVEPNEGSVAEGFGGDCSDSGRDDFCLIQVQGRVDVTVNVNLQRFPLTVDLSGNGSVTGAGIDCPGDCSEEVTGGSQVTLTADPDEGWEFSGWNGACSGTQPTCTVEMDGAREVMAVFDRETFPLATTVVGDGRGTISGPGISCPDDCSETYDEGTNLTLTATPDPGSTFEGWGGACSGTSSTCDVTMDSARNVSATFEPVLPPPPEEFALNVDTNGDGSGTVTGDGINCEPDCDETYDEGTNVTLTATPDDGSVFEGWSGDCTGTSTTCDVTMNSDQNVTAQFDLAQADVQHQLDVFVEGDGSGSVSGDGISCPEDCDESYDEGTAVTLTAAPGSDSEFDSWDGCDSSDNESCTVTMNAPAQVTATFSPLDATFTLALQFAGDGSGSVTIDPSVAGSCSEDCTETYEGSTDVTLTADADDDSIFNSWSGDCSGDSNPCELTVDTDSNVTVTFDIDSTDDGDDSEDDDVQTTG